MAVRAKFFCRSKNEIASSDGNGFSVEMVAVSSGSEENKSFFKYTPSGNLTMGVVNKATASEFEVGKEYYLDFTKA
jgi:hypothetical protein